jgi:ATP-dependent Clp protease ATP-binding subunit ClpC
MFDRFSSGSRKLMGIARAEARDLGHDVIDAEHLLLGILRDKGSAGTVILRSVGEDPDQVRKRIVQLMPAGTRATSDGGQVPFSPRAKSVLEFSLDEAERHGHQHVGTGHILLGLLRLSDGPVADVLSGVDRASVLKEVGEGTEHGTMSIGQVKVGASPGLLRILEELTRRVDGLEKRLDRLERGR